MASYYNENDPRAAAWLAELIKARQIPDGQVDTRSIVDVRSDDLRGFRHCHFFAGIGGWAYALRLAGWPDDRPVWTGSCPCQPWSVAGAGQGTSDPRHLWPAWFRHIGECRPGTIFGEQTASKDGEYWVDLVSVDLEAACYAFAPFDLPAASVGAPHGRPRFYFVAHDNRVRRQREPAARLHDQGPCRDDAGGRGAVGAMADAEGGGQRADGRAPRPRGYVDERGQTCELDHSERDRRRTRRHPDGGHDGIKPDAAGEAGELGHAEHGDGRREQPARGARRRSAGSAGAGAVRGGLGDASGPGSQRHAGDGDGGDEPGWFGAESAGPATAAGAVRGFWGGAEWVRCLEPDGSVTFRPVEPGTFPLAYGIPARVGRLRGYGNAIVPELAAALIAAYMELDETS